MTEKVIYGRNLETDLIALFAIVEASSEEYQQLWQQYASESFIKEWRVDKQGLPLERWSPSDLHWVSQGNGWGQTVSKILDMPVCISLRFATIEGRRVCFWEATSQLVYYPDIAKWFAKNVPNHDKVETSDATNFHNIVAAIDRANNEKKQGFVLVRA